MSSVQFDPRLSNNLNLDTLKEGMPGITPQVGAYLAGAATTCLEEENHNPGVAMRVGGDCTHRVEVLWNREGDREHRRRAWNDPEVATEQGAYGIAALLIHALTEYTVVERARKGHGFDYWLGKKESESLLFQHKSRLEVSGIRRGDNLAVESRVRRKQKQMERSNGPLPGVVVVVEFGTPQARVKTR